MLLIDNNMCEYKVDIAALIQSIENSNELVLNILDETNLEPPLKFRLLVTADTLKMTLDKLIYDFKDILNDQVE